MPTLRLTFNPNRLLRYSGSLVNCSLPKSNSVKFSSKENSNAIKELRQETKENADAIRELRQETKEQGIRFFAYQQASQWVVNLAFGLLATATVTTIITAVFRK